MAVIETNLQLAVKSALDGPSKKDIEIDKHSWNIDKATVTRNADSVTVNGWGGGDNISRRRSFKTDDQFDYRFTLNIGDTIDFDKDIEIRIKKGGGIPVLSQLKDAALFLWEATKIVIEIWETVEKICKALGGCGADDDPDTGELIKQIRSKSDDVKKELDGFLDGTVEGEGRFIIANIALAAITIELARQKKFALPLPADKAPELVAQPEKPIIRIKNVAPPQEPVGPVLGGGGPL